MDLTSNDNCFVCNEIMGYFKSELSTITSYTEKPIYQLIESFAEIELSEDIICTTGICQSCLIKFNEYDEFITKAEKIQFDIIKLMENKVMLLEMAEEAEDDDENKQEVKLESNDDDDDPIEFEPEMYFEAQEVEESIITEEVHYKRIIDSPVREYQLEVVVDDTKDNAMDTYQSNQQAESEFIVSPEDSTENGDGYVVKYADAEQTTKIFQCDICYKNFKDKTKVKLHREIHTDQRNVICQQCGKGFKTMNCLRNHKRTHLAERILYACDQCDKKYTQKVQLKKHIEIVHMQRRDFKCTTCGSSFGTKSVLKMHMLSHSNVRNEECPLCGFRVHTKAKLRRHMKSHTGIRDYECGICGKMFLYSYNVIAHVRNVHDKKRAFQQAGEEEEYEYRYEDKIVENSSTI